MYNLFVSCYRIPAHIGHRELNTVKTKLKLEDEDLKMVQLDSSGPGNILSIYVRSDELTETFTGFGQKNVSAERVAIRAVKEVYDYLLSSAPVGPYLSDQLLIPMALAGKSRIMVSRLTSHTTTNIKVIEEFCDLSFKIEQIDQRRWEIRL